MPEPVIRVELAWKAGDTVRVVGLQVPRGATIAQALATAIDRRLLDDRVVAGAGIAVFGRRRGPDEPLHDGDRIELAGTLKVDPKLARQRRVAHRRAAQGRSKWNPDA